MTSKRFRPIGDDMLATAPNRTLIIDEQVLYAKALAQVLMLDPAIKMVGDAESLSETYVRATRPDLILVDIDGGCVDLVEAVHISRTASPNVKICALSMHLEPDVLRRCLDAGVDGYIVKDVTPHEFLCAIKTVAGGKRYVDPRIAGRLLRRTSHNNGFADPGDLSTRETQVVRLIVAGMSNKEISANLHLSEKTIKNHISRIFTKFNCTARTQAAVYALRSGLV